MKPRIEKTKFKLKDIAPFDARRGYKAHPEYGVSTSHERRIARADYWNDRNGKLFIRIISGEHMTSKSVREYAAAIRERYLNEAKQGKGKILDEFPCPIIGEGSYC